MQHQDQRPNRAPGTMVSARIILVWCLSAALVSATLGCSIGKAAKQPGLKDLSVLDKGTPRGRVISELGKPTFSEEQDGKTVDWYQFVQGYHAATKVGRALFHAAADVFTLGLWELVANPIEDTATGTEMSVEVRYDEYEKVETTVVHKGKSELPSGEYEEGGEDVFASVAESSSSPISSAQGQLGDRIQDLANQLSTSLNNHAISRIAVLPVSDASGAVSRPLGNYLTDKLANALYKTGSVKVVERSQLEKVIDELALTMSGRFDDVSVKRIGQLLGVDALIMGIYTELGSHTVEVNSRIVNVETAEVLGVGTIQISRATVRRLL